MPFGSPVVACHAVPPDATIAVAAGMLGWVRLVSCGVK